ncbi:MAG: ATP-dependent RecD-like DNA helicase, partial [Holosporaceae bacterium]|nr:ATP-dependent RecD-like DNA helicase [Holosporaceae bacterium]
MVSLKGQLEYVSYENNENSYVVAKVRVYGYRDLVTIVGNIPSPTPGEILSMLGEWHTHPKFGKQFRVVFCKCSMPASVAGIEKYLGSGLIKGIGPVFAKRIVAKFAEKTLDIIEESPRKLMKVDGIGRYRLGIIEQAWSRQKEIRSVMIFLQSYGVSSAHASKIYRQYGNESIAVVKENPYRLAHDIWGIGFITADKIAQKLGVDQNSLIRAEAGILYVLRELTDEGHVYYPIDGLMEKASEMLKMEKDILAEAIKNLQSEKKIVVENLESSGDLIQGVFLSGYYLAEIQIVKMLRTIRDSQKRIKNIDVNEAIDRVQRELSITLAEKQLEAVRAAITHKLLVITGAPGTGKTTIMKSILRVFEKTAAKVLLTAPTGRAAKRMTEAAGMEAKTIHRLLEFDVANDLFQKNAEHQLDCDLIIVDESSMIDTLLMCHLLRAIPQFATMILVGDVNQLPSIRAGSILKDIIESESFAVVKLDEIFRQARQSNIILNAHRIINGRYPVLNNAESTDFYFIAEDATEKVLEKIIHVVQTRIPERFGYDPINDIQVLTPMTRGIVGTIGLNESLQDSLNLNGSEILHQGRRYRLSDKVM